MAGNNQLAKENARPFLRWAGGKNWFTKYLENISNLKFKKYHEAFLGGASTFFHLQPKRAFLSDLNSELIETYTTIRDHAAEVIRILKRFENTEEYYYNIRAQQFETNVERCARFIFLNQTSYNGIYRVNLKGVYNVPFGFRKKDFINEQNLYNVQASLKNAVIENCDFYDIINNVEKRDLVFLDPPYTVSHNNNGFIKYNEKIFQLEDQIRLSRLIDDIKRKGAFYILTNAAHKTIDEIFAKGDKKLVLQRASLIGGAKSTRGQISEFIFTNTDL